MARQQVKVLDIPLSLRLRLAHMRLSNRMFCWLAVHAPRLAEAWALKR